MSVFDWLNDHVIELVTALGVGGGGGMLGKKAMEKTSNKDIQEVKKKVECISIKIVDLENRIDMNTEFDKQLRKDIDGRLLRIENQNNLILQNLLNK